MGAKKASGKLIALLLLAAIALVSAAIAFAETAPNTDFNQATDANSNEISFGIPPAQDLNSDSNTEPTITYSTQITQSPIQGQDQNISTEWWGECSYASPAKHCLNSSPADSANTFQWAFYDCTNARKITEGTKCYMPGDTVCTDWAQCPSGHKCQFWYNTTVTPSCTPCNDDCSQGATRCITSWYRETCGNYDPDSCFEWGNQTYCQYGCSSGQCNSTEPCTDDPACSYNGQTRCNGSNREVCGNYDSDPCLEWQSTYCPDGCENGNCRTCTSHYTARCVSGDLYWFDSCGRQQELKEDCRVSCDPIYVRCENGCKANWKIYAFDLWRNGKANTTIQFDLRDSTGWQFAGQTNSTGLLEFSKIIPYGCYRSVNIKAISAEGALCGENWSLVEKENDTDTLFFNCPWAIALNGLVVSISTDKSTYTQGENVSISIHVADWFGSPVQGASIGLILPDNSKATAPTTNSSGNSTYAFTANGTGNQKITVVANKVGYFVGYAEKNISFDAKNPWLVDSDGDGLSDGLENLISTNSNDPKSNLVETLGGVTDFSVMCGSFLPFRVFSVQQKEAVINELNAQDSVKSLQNSQIMQQGTTQNATTFSEALKNSDEIQVFSKKDGTIIVLTDKQTGQIFTFLMPAACEGFYKGIAYGATQGLTDDVALVTGIGYYALYFDELEQAMNDISPAVNTILSKYINYALFCKALNLELFLPTRKYCNQIVTDTLQQVGKFISESLGGIVQKAEEANTKYNKNPLEKAQFTGGFTVGYIGGYWAEQIAISKGIATLSKAAIKTAGVIAARAGAAIAKFGKTTAIGRALLPQLDEVGSIGFATVGKARKTATSFELFYAGLTNAEARAITQKIGRITNALEKTMTKTELDEVMDIMLNNVGYQRVLISYTDDIGEVVARVAGGSLRPWSKKGVESLAKIAKAKGVTSEVVKNIDSIKNVKGIDNFLTILEPQIDKSGELGLLYQLEKTAQLQKSGKIVIAIEERIVSGPVDVTVDVMYKDGSSMIIREVKYDRFLDLDTGLIAQLKNYYTLRLHGKADYAELVVRGMASEEVKDFCLKYSIRLFEGVG